MNYRTTEQADADISDLFVEGARTFGVRQAEKYEDELFRTFRLLGDNPFIARERPEIDRPVRLHPFRSHLIVYAVRDEGVLIVRVLHGRQDWERWLP